MSARLVLAVVAMSIVAAQEPGPESAIKSASESVVILSGKQGGKEIVATGAVIHKTKDRALILTTLRIATLAQPGSLEAVLGASGGRKVPVKILVTDEMANIAIVGIEGPDLPDPLKIDPSVKAPERTSIQVVGAESPSSVGRKTLSLQSTLAFGGGAVWGELTEAKSDPSWDGAVALSAAGAVIGFLHVHPEGKPPLVLCLDYFKEYFAGLPVGGSWVEKEVKPGEIRGTYRCHMMDQKKMVRSATLILTRLDLVQRPAERKAGGLWSSTVGSPQESYSLVLREGEASGEFSVKFAMMEDAPFVAQVRFERDSGVAYGAPHIYVAPFSKTKAGVQKDDWIEGKGTPGGGSGVPSGASLGKPKRSVDDVTIVDLDVMPAQVMNVDSALLSEDGAFLFVLGQPNLLRKIRTSDLVEERQLVIPVTDSSSVVGLGISRAGLVILAGRPVELFVIDEGMLTIRRKVFISVEGHNPEQKTPSGLNYRQPSNLIASPASSHVFIQAELVRGGQVELVVDAGAGRITRDFVVRTSVEKAWASAKKHEESPRIPSSALGRARMTPDGRFLVGNQLGALQRWRVTGSDMVLEEIGPALGTDLNFSPVSMSPDGMYVTLVKEGGHRPPKDHPVLANANYIYKVSDLQRPWAAVHWPALGRATRMELAYDREPGQLYAGLANQLMIFNSLGRMIRQVALMREGGQIRELLVHPEGLKLAAITMSSVHWVELPPTK